MLDLCADGTVTVDLDDRTVTLRRPKVKEFAELLELSASLAEKADAAVSEIRAEVEAVDRKRQPLEDRALNPQRRREAIAKLATTRSGSGETVRVSDPELLARLEKAEKAKPLTGEERTELSGLQSENNRLQHAAEIASTTVLLGWWVRAVALLGGEEVAVDDLDAGLGRMGGPITETISHLRTAPLARGGQPPPP